MSAPEAAGTQQKSLFYRDPEKAARMEQYVEWLLVPEAHRVPNSKRKLAEEMGITPQTLRNYDREPWVHRELTQRARAIARVQDAPQVLATLRDQAIDPTNPRSVTAAKVWLDWISKTVEPVSATDISELSDSELFELAVATIGARGVEAPPLPAPVEA